MNTASNRKKVLVIGLDGGTFSLLSPMMERGLLPNLKRLGENGVCGPLQSVIPPITGPAWVSFMTGNMPGKHGILDFFKSNLNGGPKRVINAKDIASPTLWELITHHQKTTCVFNVPVTYPPQELKGFMWTGSLTPPNAGKKRCYPPALYDELENNVGRLIPNIPFRSYKEGEKPKLIKDLADCMEQRGKYTTYLMQKYDWDFFMTVIAETDIIQHTFGNHLFNVNIEQGTEQKRGEILSLIDEFYQKMDAQIGEFCRLAGDQSSIFVVSDHGFGPLSKGFFMNQWLNREGFLSIRHRRILNLYTKFLLTRTNPLIRSLFGLSHGHSKLLSKALTRTIPIIRGLFRRLDPKGIRHKILRRSPDKSNPVVKFDHILNRCIDWKRTKAYMDVGTQQGIFVNLKGRQSMGIVNEGEEYEEVRESIIKRLKNLKDPQTERSVVSHVFKKEEIYSGRFSEDAPDIIFFLDNLQILATFALGFNNDLFYDPFWPMLAYHRMDGVFIASGTNIRRREVIKDARLIDIMPTILYAMGLPVPDGLDGKPLSRIFTDPFLKSTPLRRMESGKVTTGSEGGAGVMSEEENKKVEEALKDLGYL